MFLVHFKRYFSPLCTMVTSDVPFKISSLVQDTELTGKPMRSISGLVIATVI